MKWLRVRALSGDGGFTLIEVMVAMLIISVVMMSLGYVLTNSLLDAAYGRQRVEATNLANQAVEEVRSLASSSSTTTGWNYVLTTGMARSDTNSADDPNIVNNQCFEGHPLDIGGNLGTCGAARPWTYRTSCSGAATSPPPTGTLTWPQPLQPHEACYTLDGTTYIVDSYLTGTGSGSASAPLSLTVVVSWTNSYRGGSGTQSDVVSTTTQLAGCSVQLSCV